MTPTMTPALVVKGTVAPKRAAGAGVSLPLVLRGLFGVVLLTAALFWATAGSAIGKARESA